MRYSNGDVYEGEWRSSRRHGEGRMQYSDGRMYQGRWLEDSPGGAPLDLNDVSTRPRYVEGIGLVRFPTDSPLRSKSQMF